MLRIRYLLLICIACVLTAHAQSDFKYHYWFDNDDAAIQMVAAGEQLQLDIDVAALTEGLHTLHLQTVDDEGVASAPLTSHFIKSPLATELDKPIRIVNYLDGVEVSSEERTVPETGGVLDYTFDASALPVGLHTLTVALATEHDASVFMASRHFLRAVEDVSLAQLKCYYKVDYDSVFTEVTNSANGVYDLTLDMSKLDEGLHRLSYFVAYEDGTVGAMQNAFFIRAANETQRMKCYYAIDGGDVYTEAGSFTEGEYTLNLNAKELEAGVHRVTYFFVTELGVQSAPRSAHFVAGMQDGPEISGYNYWVAGDEEHRQSIALESPTDSLGISELLMPAQTFSSADFVFEMNDGKPVVYNTKEFTIQFLDTEDGKLERSGSYGDMTTAQDVDASWIYSDVPATVAIPEANTIVWRKFKARQGDELEFSASDPGMLNLYSPTGATVLKHEGETVTEGVTCTATETGVY